MKVPKSERIRIWRTHPERVYKKQEKVDSESGGGGVANAPIGLGCSPLMLCWIVNIG